jgi:RHS repeat-associated protein
VGGEALEPAITASLLANLGAAGTVHSFVVDSNGNPFNEYAPALARVTGGFFDYEANEAEFNYLDQLGTPRLSTDYTGAVVRTKGALMGPFGDNFTETNTSLDFTGFAGGFWDTENNGDHFGAREYQKTHGSWLSPDPAGMATVDITNPQTWNRSAYVANNPVSFTDPTGLDLRGPCIFDGCGGGGGGGGGCIAEDPACTGSNPPGECSPGDPGCCDMWSNPLCGWPPPGPGPGGPGDGPGGPGPRGGSTAGGTHGPWPGSETTGLPQLPTQPLSLGDLLGLTPGCDFGVCNSIVFGFANGMAPGSPGWWQNFTSWLSNWYWSKWPKPQLPNLCNRGDTRIQSVGSKSNVYIDGSTGTFQSNAVHQCEGLPGYSYTMCSASALGPSGPFAYCDCCSAQNK